MTIDELIVSLVLDSTKFTEGQRKAIAEFKRTQEEAKKRGKDIEDNTKRVLRTVAEYATRFFAVVSGGKEILEFISNQIEMGAALGRTAKVLETSTETLGVWQNIARVTGGSAQAMTGTIRGLVGQFQQFAITGESAVIPYFRSLGIAIADDQGKMRPFEDILFDLAESFSKMDPAKAAAWGAAMRIDPETINLLIRGGPAMRDLIEEQKKAGVVTKEWAETSQEIIERLSLMQTRVEGAGRAMLIYLLGPIIKVIDAVRQGKLLGQLVNLIPIIGPILHVAAVLLGRDEKKKSTANIPTEQGGPGPSGTATPTSAEGLRLKPGATAGGGANLGTLALANSLQESIPGLQRFTAINDAYHQGRRSKHNEGLALDFSLKGGKGEAPAVAAQIRARLAAMGVNAKVLDEYNEPSPGSTGGHIHVQFQSDADAARYREMAGVAAEGGGVGSNVNNSRTNTSQINIQNMNINTPTTDGAKFAQDFREDALRRQGLVTNANMSPRS